MYFGIFAADNADGWVAELWRPFGRVVVEYHPILQKLNFSFKDFTAAIAIRTARTVGIAFAGVWLLQSKIQPLPAACVCPGAVPDWKFAVLWISYTAAVACYSTIKAHFRGEYYGSLMGAPALGWSLPALVAPSIGAWLIAHGYGRIAAAATALEVQALREGIAGLPPRIPPTHHGPGSCCTEATAVTHSTLQNLTGAKAPAGRKPEPGYVNRSTATRATQLAEVAFGQCSKGRTAGPFVFGTGDYSNFDLPSPWMFVSESRRRQVSNTTHIYFTPLEASSRTLAADVFDTALARAGYARLDGLGTWITSNCGAMDEVHNNLHNIICAFACIINTVKRGCPDATTLVIVGDSTLAQPFKRRVQESGSITTSSKDPSTDEMAGVVRQLQHADKLEDAALALNVAHVIGRHKKPNGRLSRAELVGVTSEALSAVIPSDRGLQLIVLASSGSRLADEAADSIYRQIRTASILWPTAPIVMVGGWNNQGDKDLKDTIDSFLAKVSTPMPSLSPVDPPKRCLEAFLSPFAIRVAAHEYYN